MSDQAKCKSCGAPVIWAKTAAGRLAPYDAAASRDVPKGYRIVAGVSEYVKDNTGTMFPLEPLHTSHFATCPNAARHRK